MPKRFPLQPLLDLAQSHADDAAKQLQALRVKWHQAEEKLKELIGYREDYRARLLQATKQGLTVASWRDFQLFLDKLDRAIQQQEEVVAQCKHRWESGQREWLARQRKVKAFDTLAQRHVRSEQKREAKREQRDLDEFATKRFERSEDGEEP